MTTHDNAPPPAEWRCDPRPCECFERSDLMDSRRVKRDDEIPPNIILGSE